MSNHISLDQHAAIAEEINDIIERITHLEVFIANCGGKTKTRKIYNKLSKARDMVVDARWDLENEMLHDYPDAPLYTSYRDYRGKLKPLRPGAKA